jgi:hypothetical protein
MSLQRLASHPAIAAQARATTAPLTPQNAQAQRRKISPAKRV